METKKKYVQPAAQVFEVKHTGMLMNSDGNDGGNGGSMPGGEPGQPF